MEHSSNISRSERIKDFLRGVSRTSGITAEPVKSDFESRVPPDRHPQTIDEAIQAAVEKIDSASLEAMNTNQIKE